MRNLFIALYQTIKLGPVGKKRRDKSFSSILFHVSFLNALLTLQSKPALRTPALGWISTVAQFLRACTRTYTGFTRVNYMDARYKLSVELKREVEWGSTFTFTRYLSYIASILFAKVNFTHVRTLKLRDRGNPPLYGHLIQHYGQLTLSLRKESPFIFSARTSS